MTTASPNGVTARWVFSRLVVAAAYSTFAFQYASATNLHDGLAAYWSLDEGTGTVAHDTFGTEMDNGQVREDPDWLGAGDAILGDSALRFDGFAQDVLVPSSSDLDITMNAVTLSAWVNMDLLPTDLFDPFGGIYDSAQDAYVLYLDRGTQELRFKVTTSDGIAERPGVPESLLTVDSWHHVMGVYDGAEGVAKIYYDGVPIDRHESSVLTGTVLSGQVAGIGSNPLMDVDNPGSYFFSGAIDDVAVWDRALGRGEAEYLYNSGVGTAVGAANPDIPFIPDVPPVVPVEPSVDPTIFYRFEGDLQNDGSAGSELDGTLDEAGFNDPPFGPGTVGLGLDLRNNPISQADAGDSVSVEYELPESGTIAFDFTVDKYYNYQSLWTNDVNPDDWEMWIYNDGRLRGRVEGDAYVTFDLDTLDGLDSTYHVAFTWERDEDNVAVKLYVDGELRDQDAAGTWVDPGTMFYIGGGDGTNHYGAGIWDEFQIYNVALSEGEILYLAGSGEPGDYNENGQLDAGDLDLQAIAMEGGEHPPKYDLNDDGLVNFDDRLQWVEVLKNTWIGDANLDGEFNSSDMVQVFSGGKYETGENAGWEEGDWNGNTTFGSGDMVAAFVGGGYELGKKEEPAMMVPEPSGIVLLLIALGGFSCWRRRN